MNILCKILGHRMYYDTPEFKDTSCVRWLCDHRKPYIIARRAPTRQTAKADKV